MTQRITHKDAERAARRLADALGLPYGHYVTVDEEPGSFDGERPEGRYKVQTRDGRWRTTQPNAIEINYNPTYGGVVLQHIADDGGTWVTSGRFSQMRRTPREFVEYVNSLLTGMELAS